MSLESISFHSEEVIKTEDVLRHVLHSSLKSVRVLLGTGVLGQIVLLINYQPWDGTYNPGSRTVAQYKFLSQGGTPHLIRTLGVDCIDSDGRLHGVVRPHGIRIKIQQDGLLLHRREDDILFYVLNSTTH
jgi:hypothetical protein